MFQKRNTGADLNALIEQANLVWYGLGMTEEQVLWTTALVDHESAGSWSTTIKGDSGCSIGIAQWNSCVGRIAPATFEEQVQLIGDEMLAKFQTFPLKTAIGKHNAPSYEYNAGYIDLVEKSIANFSEK